MNPPEQRLQRLLVLARHGRPPVEVSPRPFLASRVAAAWRMRTTEGGLVDELLRISRWGVVLAGVALLLAVGVSRLRPAVHEDVLSRFAGLELAANEPADLP